MFWLFAMSLKIDSMSNQIPGMIIELMNKAWNNHLPYYIQKIFSVKILGTFFIRNKKKKYYVLYLSSFFVKICCFGWFWNAFVYKIYMNICVAKR